MNLTLTDLLTTAQIEQAHSDLADTMEAIVAERAQELSRIHRLYEERCRAARREAILKVLQGETVAAELTIEALPAVDVPPVEEAPRPALPQAYTASEIAAKLGVHKDTVAYYKKTGLLPDPLPGSGGKPGSPYLYEIPDWKAFKQRVNERRNGAIGAGAKAQIRQLQEAKGGNGNGKRYTSKELADAMGAHPSSVSNWVRAGWVTPLDLPDVRGFVFEVPDIEALRQEFLARRQAAKEANGARLVASKPQPTPEPVQAISTPAPEPISPSPEPKSLEIALPELEAEAPQEMVGLEKASRHPYHWSQALPIVEAAIEQAEEEPFELAYQRSAEAFVVRPLGGVSADLDPFARVVLEAGQWQIIPSLRTGWLAPQAQALRAAWQRTHAGSVSVRSGVSTTRSLQP